MTIELAIIKKDVFQAKAVADKLAPSIKRLSVYKEALQAVNKLLNNSLSLNTRYFEGKKAYGKFLEARFWQHYKNCGNTLIIY